MYKIVLDKRRYNNKTFPTYEEARKYVRRLVTKLVGEYRDDYSWFGFKVVRLGS